MILIKNVDIYSPEHIGIKDVLISGGTIALIKDEIQKFDDSIKVIDGKGQRLIPGLVDQHVHITGGGGEDSFRTRVPEITLSKLTGAGITTAVGLLGTDSTTRSIENLVAKAKALKEEGLTVYAITGSYEYPTKTLTGEVKKDICFIDEVIGAKVAIADHRSSSITTTELAKIASEARVAGMLSGKAGILVVHMGHGPSKFLQIFKVLETTDVPLRTIRPTHVNKNLDLLAQGFEYIAMGGMIDLTCGSKKERRPSNVIMEAISKKLPVENITVSSDAYGSWSRYDECGNLLKIGVASVDNFFNELKHLTLENGLSLEKALPFFSTNVAKGLSIYPRKGTIAVDSDADFILLDDNFNIDTVIAMGKIMVQGGQPVILGTYEG